MVLYIIILFKVEIMMLRFFFIFDFYNFVELFFYFLCFRILYSVLFF